MNILLKRASVLLSLVINVACGVVDVPKVAGGSQGKGSSDIGGSMELSYDLKKCGFDLEHAGANVSSQQLSIVPINKTVTTKILGGILTSQTDVTINGLLIQESSLLRSVSSYSSGSTPAVDSDEVAAMTSKFTLSASADILPIAERSKIGEIFADWKGLFCTYQPAKKLERGNSEKIVVELDKPIPVTPLVVADASRLVAELGVRRSWSGITAKVVDSTDTAVSVGTIYRGTVTAEPVNPVIAVDSPTGKLTVQTDIAVKVTYNFGSAANQRSLGLPSSVIWYIDANAKAFKLVQVDTGDGDIRNYFPK